MSETARTVDGGWRPAGLCSFFVCDIASFTDPSRTDALRVRVREAMYGGLIRALESVGLQLGDCYHEDRGDGVMLVVPPATKTELLLTTGLERLRAEVRHHNAASSEAAQMRLRVAVHVGEAESDGHGIVSSALTHTFRLLDAEPLKTAVRTAETGLVLIVSQRVYDDVVQHGRGLVDPGDYYQVEVRVKETACLAWIMVPGVRPEYSATDLLPREERAVADSSEAAQLNDKGLLFQAVNDLLDIPRLRTERGRDQVVGALSMDIAGAIPRSGEARADLYAILWTCLDYPGGLQQLLQTVRGFVGESMAVLRFEQTIAHLLQP